MGEPEGAEARPGDTGAAKGRTFMVTGANTGIGRATAAALAGQGGRVYVASRSREKGEEAVAWIKASTGNEAVWFLPLDLADLDSVRACASAFLATGEPLHVLVNNAGVVRSRGLTRQGLELMFGVNRDLAGRGAGQRQVLRQVRGARPQPGCHPRTGRGAVEAQRGVDGAVVEPIPSTRHP